MNIYWHGLTCVRIEAETRIGPVSLITDPFSAEKTGVKFPKSLTPDVVVLSHQEKKRFDLSSFENDPFVIQDPGEYEVKGMYVFGIGVENEDKSYPHGVIYRFSIEGASFGFLGGIHRIPTEKEIALLENIDVLLLPVGGHGQLDAKMAIDTMTRIEPRLVIPLGHAIDGLATPALSVEDFCSASACKRQDSTKLKLQKKDLPVEETIVTVLERA